MLRYCRLLRSSSTFIVIRPVQIRLCSFRSFKVLQNTSSILGAARSVIQPNQTALFSTRSFDHESDETLESLCERFEELLDDHPSLAEGDVTLASGVLTVILPPVGTYVINKQTPNQQIWLSSPLSGPARFDLTDGGTWVYKHTGEALHELLEREVGKEVLRVDAGFRRCHGGGSEEQ